MQNDNKNSVNIDLIAKYLVNETSLEENQSVESWKNSSKENWKFFDEYKKVWDTLGKHKQIADIDVDKEWNKLNNRISVRGKAESPKTIRMFRPLLRVAAVFLVLAGLSTGIFYLVRQQQYETYTAVSKVKQVDLSDGSSVTLNTNASVAVPPGYKEKTRTIKLEGEAFFEVKPDKTKPFIVKAGKIIVEVTGTSFYVNAPKNKEKAEVIVKTGTVIVYKKGEQENKVGLQAGEKVSFLHEKEMLAKQENKDINYLSWKTRHIEFHAQTLEEIVQTLNNVYYTHIIIKNDAIKDCRVTVTFEKQPLQAVLEVLKSTLDLDITKKHNTIIISGSGC